MRLSAAQASVIKSLIKKIRPDSNIYLFGSRVDDDKRGGDIDILIVDDDKLDYKEKTQIETAFSLAFGEQKVDLVCFPPHSEHPFKKIALQQAIEL